MPNWFLELAACRSALPDATANERYRDFLRHGTMRTGLYAPHGEDLQEPHGQDEIYVIATGTAEFAKAEDRVTCQPGDLLFVEAGLAHRFERMSPDFAAWVVFWGPQNGEPDPVPAQLPG